MLKAIGLFFQEVVESHDLGDEFLSLFDGRDLEARRDYPVRAGIISGQGQGHVPLKGIQQGAKIAAPRQDILPGVEGIAHPQRSSRARHELHQPHGAFGRHGLVGKIGFLPDDRQHQGNRQSILLSRLDDASLQGRGKLSPGNTGDSPDPA